MIDLGQWLIAHGKTKRVAGLWDCCAMPAQWCMDNGYPDPMAYWRGLYATEDEGDEWIAKAGGLTELFVKGMASVGISTTAIASPGVIGTLKVGDDEAGAIYTGKRWALVANRGIAFVSFTSDDVVQMWAV